VIDNLPRETYNAKGNKDVKHRGRYRMISAVTWQSNPPEKLLKERFRISTGFHPGQRNIIEQLVQGKRLLVIQRTGWGKSLEICTEI
jgi:superfamily II DNA helicase RecQ